MWIFLAVIGAFFQAVGAAIKKKSLQTPGMNNVIGFISFTLAGAIFGLIYFTKTGGVWPSHLSLRFWNGMFWFVGLNVVAFWFMYRALDLAEFNYLMPFMTLTSLSVIIPPIFIFGEIPSLSSFAGIILVVIGALGMNWKQGKAGLLATEVSKEQKRNNRKGVIYFIATALCFTITPTAAKVAVTESSVLFASFLVHILIGIAFLVIATTAGELAKVKTVLTDKDSRPFLIGIALAGLAIVAENWSVNFALSVAPVAYVMAIKRTMPLFAFLIGLFYFKEHTELPQKILNTALMVIGAVLITIFK